MKIQVTENDISRGLPNSNSYCPVALAIKRKYPFYVRVGVTITIGSASYNIPPKVRSFIKDFDHEKKVYPFEFELTSCD